VSDVWQHDVPPVRMDRALANGRSGARGPVGHVAHGDAFAQHGVELSHARVTAGFATYAESLEQVRFACADDERAQVTALKQAADAVIDIGAFRNRVGLTVNTIA
jgi:hypothetical protein